MKVKTVLAGIVTVVLTLYGSGCDQRGRSLHLGGGPAGGTFMVAAEALGTLFESQIPGRRVVIERSGGSLGNLRAIEQGNLDLALVYSGDLWQAANEKNRHRLPEIKQTRVLSRLYPAAAQLVVPASSRVTLPTQLRGYRVGIGSPGSGAALAAERYFRALDLWEKLIPVYLGYDMAMAELLRGNLGAVWEMVGIPSPSVMRTTQKVPLRLLNLHDSAMHGNFYTTYPFYQPFIISAGTYPHQRLPVQTFEDSALLVANEHVSPAEVKQLLEVLFSKEGLARLRAVHPVLLDFGPEQALKDIPLALHSGAADFWQSRGYQLPAKMAAPIGREKPLAQ